MVNAVGLSRLLSLINPAFVRNFRVFDWDGSRILLEKAIEFPMLRGLDFTVFDISSDEEDQLLESVMAQPWVKQLESLRLSGLERSGVWKLACAATSLEELALPTCLNTEHHLTRLADIWRTAQDGRSPKLVDLDVGDAAQDQYACVGRLFPRLHTLSCRVTAPACLLAPMTNLEELCIHEVSPVPTPLETAAALRALLTACPNLKRLTLFARWSAPYLPAMDNVFSSLPPTLEELSVAGIALRASDFPNPLPLLHRAAFLHCGAESMPLVAQLRERSPHLKKVAVYCSASGVRLRV